MNFNILFNKYESELNNELNYSFKNDYGFLKNNFIQSSDINCDKSLLNKLNLVNDDNEINNVFIRTKTHLGKFFLTSKINSPTDCLKKLNFNKECIKCFSDKTKYEFVLNKLEELKNKEYSLVSLFDEDYIKNIHFKPLYFSDILEKLNNNVYLLNCYTLFNIHYSKYYILSPIIILIIPLLLSKLIPCLNFLGSNFLFKCLTFMTPSFDIFKCKNITDLLVNSMYIIFFVYNSYTSLKLSKHINIVYKHINTQLKHLNELVKCCTTIYKFKDIGKDIRFSSLPNLKCITLFDKCYDDSFLHYGNSLVLFNQCINLKEEFIPYLKFIGFIDYLISINTLILEDNYTLVNYSVEDSRPELQIKDLNHPLIKNSVSNTVILNSKKQNTTNMLITGPNTSGKSTFIKSVLINIYLSQTLGISKSKFMTLTPFSTLKCFTNTSDKLGKQSFFETEIKNIINYIKIVEDLNKNKKNKKYGFVIIDEILNGTNRKDSISVSYVLCKKLFGFDNSLSLVTTHQNYLGKLEKHYNVKNYKMNITYDKDIKQYKNTYKLGQGLSDVYLGIDVLKKTGVSNEIIEEAEKIKKIINN
jgi:hypothetical protein